ncbi:TPA: hypothetical protein BOS_12579 [Bos taurus]|nr:TPA: hypothetical protein BOS_12579 [Bos taurus]
MTRKEQKEQRKDCAWQLNSILPTEFRSVGMAHVGHADQHWLRDQPSKHQGRKVDLTILLKWFSLSGKGPSGCRLMGEATPLPQFIINELWSKSLH